MNKYFLVSCLLLMNCLAFSQDADSTKKWTLSGVPSFLVNQANFSNWQAGGANSLSWTAKFDAQANYTNGKWHWNNTFKYGYGQQFQEETDWRKTDDVIDFNTQLSRGIDEKQHWRFLFELSFITQSTEGFEYTDTTSITTSDWLAPAYVNSGIGFLYKPTDYFELGIQPISTKLTIVNDQDIADSGAFGNEAAEYDNAGALVKNGRKIRGEFGATVKMKFEKELVKNINYNTNLTLFSNYQNNPQNVDVVWNNELKFKVNDVLNFTFNLDMIYDDDITITEFNDDGSVKGEGARLQLKQLMGVGLTYTFKN